MLPAVVLFGILAPARAMDIFPSGRFAIPSLFHAVLFTLAAITALAGPLFLRTLFAHSVRSYQNVPPPLFLSFQRRLLRISLLTPYMAFAAVAFDFPRFYAAGIVLMALYALYYYYPSARRIAFDRKIFRVQ